MRLKEVSDVFDEEGEQGLSRLLDGAPVLVLRASPSDPLPLQPAVTRRWSRAEALSETHDGETVSPWAELANGDSLVVPVVKSDRNPFAGLITVGRAQSCDLRLTSSQVSKIHAYLRHRPGKGWVIKDGGSRNGTYLEGLKIEPQTDYPLAFGQQVRFGDVTGMFLGQRELISLCGMVR